MSKTIKRQGILYIVATPIGNLDDITLRAKSILQKVDLIAAEDTRNTLKLLKLLSIQNKCIAYHEHNETKAADGIIKQLQQGMDIALVSDAGTPLISDPGYVLVEKAQSLNIKVEPIPGSSAVMSALSASGLPTDRFLYIGFLPAKQTQRIIALEKLQGFDATMVFYESCHRIVKSLKDMQTVFGSARKICFARELTKQFETIKLLPVNELIEFVEGDSNQLKGEIVLIVEGNRVKDIISNEQLDNLLKLLLEQLPPSSAAKVASQYLNLKKKVCYQRALEL